MRQSGSLAFVGDLVRPRVVLDTQVVLDWLVFDDASCAPLGVAVEAGAVGWIATQAMRDELDHVLERGVAAAWRPDRAAISLAYDRFAAMLAPSAPPSPQLRCSDPDDQMFIDLALSAEANWLLTRDRALLALGRRAKPRGLIVLRPADWLLAEAAMVSP